MSTAPLTSDEERALREAWVFVVAWGLAEAGSEVRLLATLDAARAERDQARRDASRWLLQVDNLKLAVWTDSGFFTTPTVELFNWKSNDWTKLSGVSQGVNLIPGAESLVRSDGLVQVRLSSDGAQSCYYLALGLEGVLP